MEVFKLLAVAVAGTLWSAWLALYLREKGVNPMRELLDRFSRLGWVCKVGVLFLVVQLTMFGGAKHGGTNDATNVVGTNVVTEVSGTNEVGEAESGEAEAFPLQGEGLREPLPSGRPSQSLISGKDSASPLSVTDILPELSITDIARGYRLESVATNDNISYAMPSGATSRGTWHLTGAYEDVQKIGLGGLGGLESASFKFPLGNNLCTSLWAYTWGKVRSCLRGTGVSPVQGWPALNGQDARSTCEIAEIVAVGAPMSAIPSVSRFWTMQTSNDTYLLTWENFAQGRISGEAESFPLQNGIEPPLTSGQESASPFLSAQIELFRNGDFITRSNNVESVYRRVIEPNPDPLDPYGPVQDLSVINETNAYCWVDIVVNNADAWVRFEGDGPSNLADPSFAAKAGETNHVVILIGKTYKVTCDMDFSVIAKSSPSIDERWDDDHTLWINWPVTIEAWDGNGKSFMMHVVPNFLGGSFSWTNSCCSVSGSGTHFSYSCDGHCYCTGCAANGYYGYEGYRIGCNGGWCGCSYDPGEWHGGETEPDEGPYAPGITIEFSHHAIIFEDMYEESPGVTVGKHSTVTYLACVVHGGPNGGTATFTFTGRNKLDGKDLPSSVTVPAEYRARYWIRYRGESPSGNAEDIVVHGDFTENGPDGETYSDEDKLTCVKLELVAQYTAAQNASQSRHTYGVGELVKFRVTPVVSGEILRVIKADAGDDATPYDTFGGDLEIVPSAENVYRCPATGTSPDVTLSYKGVEYSPSMAVIEPQLVVTREATGSGTFWPGDVGMGILTTRNYIGPFTVSFQGVKVVEIPCTNAIPPIGYFATSNFTGQLTHVAGNAGWAHVIGVDNYWTIDEAGRAEAYENWSYGRLEWKIPIGWKRFLYEGDSGVVALEVDYANHGNSHSRPLLIGNSENAYKQVFSIESDGASAVEKFGYKLERSRWSLHGNVIKTGAR